MENHEFEQLVELAIIEDTSEHIPHQKHTFPSDFEVQLRKKAAQAGYQPVSHSVMTKKKLAENHTHHISKHRESVVPPIYAFGCLAACLLFSLGFGIMLHQNDHESLMQSTAIPLEVLESKPAVSTAISTESTAYAAERAKQKITTATTVKTDVVELTENSIYETVTSITEPLIMGQITDDIQITVTSQSIELPKVTTSTSVTSVSETTARSVETTETGAGGAVSVVSTLRAVVSDTDVTDVLVVTFGNSIDCEVTVI